MDKRWSSFGDEGQKLQPLLPYPNNACNLETVTFFNTSYVRCVIGCVDPHAQPGSRPKSMGINHSKLSTRGNCCLQESIMTPNRALVRESSEEWSCFSSKSKPIILRFSQVDNRPNQHVYQSRTVNESWTAWRIVYIENQPHNVFWTPYDLELAKTFAMNVSPLRKTLGQIMLTSKEKLIICIQSTLTTSHNWQLKSYYKPKNTSASLMTLPDKRTGSNQ